MNSRNASIIQARASGRPIQSIALEHGLSPARVSKIIQDHRKDLRIAELEAENAELLQRLSVRVFEEKFGALRRSNRPAAARSRSFRRTGSSAP